MQIVCIVFIPLSSQTPSFLAQALKKGKDSPYSITERRVPKLIPVLGS